MRKTTPQVPNCTIQRRNGEFCDAPSFSVLPYPVCKKHALTIYKEMRQIVIDGLTPPPNVQDALNREFEDNRRAQKELHQKQSVVYYIRIHDHIKIGTTGNLKERLIALRIDGKDCVLATEPGGFKLEKMRHGQFDRLRIGRKENFRPEPQLMHHIEAVRNFHGEPVMTGYKVVV